MIRQIFTAFHPELFMQLVAGYWQVFVLMGVGFALHWCPDSWQNAVRTWNDPPASLGTGFGAGCLDLSCYSGEKQ